MAQSNWDFRSHQSGNWNSTTTWEYYYKGNWRTPATSTPTSASELITIRGGHTVTVTAAVTADQVVVQTNGQLAVSSGVTFTIANGTGVDIDVSGTLQNVGTVTLNTGAAAAFESGAKYQHNRNGGTIPAASWNSGATCEVIGVLSNAPAGLGQSFHHFTWNCPGQTAGVVLGGSPPTINGSLTITNSGGWPLIGVAGTAGWTLAVGGDLNLWGGSFDFSSGTAGTLALGLGGSYNQTAGSFHCSNSGSTLNLNFTGSGKRFIQSGGVLTTTRMNFNVASNASLTLDNGLTVAAGRTCTVNGSLDCGTNVVSGPGSFTLAGGGTLRIGNAGGITAAGASGNIQVAGGRSFASGANYLYNGTEPQVCGDGLPAIVNSLTISNSTGVDLSATTTVSSLLALSKGVLSTGTNLVSLAASAAVSGGSSNNYVNGTLQKSFGSGTGQSFAFPIGDSLTYAPVSIAAMSVGVGNAGTLAASTTAGDHAGLAAAGIDATQSVNRYWTLASGGGFAPSTFNATFNFAASNVDAGASPAAWVIRRYSGGDWAATTIGTRTATSAQATELSAFGDFVVGENLADHYAVTAATPQTAGVAFNTTVTALDVFNQAVVGDSTTVVTMSGTGSVQFDGNGDGTFGDNTKTLSNGALTISTKDTVAETVALTATDASSRTGTFTNLVVNAGAASKLIVSTQPSAVATAGQPFAQQPTVLIADAFNNVRSNDTLTVTASRSSGAGTLMGVTNVAAVNGTATYTDLAHPVATNITIRFTSGTLTAATSGPVTVGPAEFSRLLALLPGETSAPGTMTGRAGTPSATAGASTAVRALATDNWFNPVNAVTDTVGVTTTDPNASLPPDVSLVNGTNTLNVVFKTSGSRTVTVTDVTDGTKLANTNTVTVQPGPFVKLQLLVPGELAAAGTSAGKTGTPQAQTGAIPFGVTVNSVDANWNLVSTNDTVRITASDPNAVLPGNAALSGGTRSFSVTMNTAGSSTLTASDVTHAGIASDTSTPIAVEVTGEAMWGIPMVAIHDSELTSALESLAAATTTPSGPGTTGFEWWPTNWHYFVMPEAMKEALRSDGTPFTVLSDADISAGNLLTTNGRPRYPILISLAAEAIRDDEVARLTNYVAAGGFVLCGSSSFTRNPDGTTRQDFAFANEMGVHMVNPGLVNWGLNSTFTKVTDHRLIGHIPSGTLTWRMPTAAEEIPWGISPAHPFLAPHLAWQVQPSNATVLAQGDVYPYLLTKPFGKGQFIYHASMQPLLGFNGFAPNMHAYLIFRKAIEWAFESAKLPVPRISPWPYSYDAAFVLRRDLENFTNAIAEIAASAQIDYTNGAYGDYYFCTGTLREDAASAYDTNAIIAGLRSAVSSYGATIGPHNGGLRNPNNPALTRGEYDYWHWGPDEALDVTPTNYASGKAYALESISNSFRDVEGWLAGLTNGLRIWASCYFNATREDSYDIQAELGVKVAGEQRLGPFPHWTLSTRAAGKRYAFLSEPTSDWFINGMVAQSLEPWRPPSVHTSQTLHEAVDFYYNLGGLINFYSHTLSTGLGDAGPLQLDYITYSLNTNLHPRLWSANAATVYQWWLQRSKAQMSVSCTAEGNQSVTTLSVAGAVHANTAVELLIPGSGSPLGLQVLTNGVLAGGDSYRTNGNLLKVQVGTSVATVQVRYVLGPRAQNDSYTVATNTPLAVASPGVLANDTAGMGTNLTAVLVGSPTNGTLILNADGSFSYTPAAGFAGADTFAYLANDGVSNSSLAAVTLYVLVPGTLFADDFTRLTDPGPLAPWVAHSGNWTVTGGLLNGGSNALHTYGFAYLTNRWTNYSVQARVRFPAGAYGGGLGSRLNPTTGARYAAWIYPEASPGGSSVLKLFKFQSWTSFGYGGSNSVPMQQVSLVAVGTNWHTLKLSLVGKELAVYYDGDRVMSVTDVEAQPYLNGGISADMWTDAADYVMGVDDVSVFSAPAPWIESIGVSGPFATISWSAVAGQSYRLQYKYGLNDSNWQDVVPDVTAEDATATANVSVEGVAQRFYRVMLVP